MKSYDLPNITLDRPRREEGHLTHPESFSDEIVNGSVLLWTIVSCIFFRIGVLIQKQLFNLAQSTNVISFTERELGII